MRDEEEFGVPEKAFLSSTLRLTSRGCGSNSATSREQSLQKFSVNRKKARRLVPMDGVTQLAEPIFHRGDGLPVGDFKKSWTTATKKAKCAGKLFHDLRRTCARRLLAAGVPQVIARELTGHRTSAMFDRYVIVSSADVLAAQKKVTQFRRQA